MQQINFNPIFMACITAWLTFSLPHFAAHVDDINSFSNSKGASIVEVVADFISDTTVIPIDNLLEDLSLMQRWSPSLQKKEWTYNFPPQNFPSVLMKRFLEAETIAKAIKSAGMTEHMITPLLLEALNHVRENRKKPDPLWVFSFLNALFKELDQESQKHVLTQRSFQLMARAVMNAPFFLEVPNTDKRNNGSFNYFALFANFLRGLEIPLGTDEKGTPVFNGLKPVPVILDGERIDVLDNGRFPKVAREGWQLYFHDDAFLSHAVPWLDALYFFYMREGWLYRQNINPFDDTESSEEFLTKIRRKGCFYDDGDGISDKDHGIWDKIDEFEQFKLKNASEKKVVTQSFHMYMKDNYLMIDPNIYWHSLRYLAHKMNDDIQQKFYHAMIKAGADPLTIIDNKGTTPLTLAQGYGLSIIENKISLYQQEVLGDMTDCTRILHEALNLAPKEYAIETADEPAAKKSQQPRTIGRKKRKIVPAAKRQENTCAGQKGYGARAPLAPIDLNRPSGLMQINGLLPLSQFAHETFGLKKNSSHVSILRKREGNALKNQIKKQRLSEPEIKPSINLYCEETLDSYCDDEEPTLSREGSSSNEMSSIKNPEEESDKRAYETNPGVMSFDELFNF